MGKLKKFKNRKRKRDTPQQITPIGNVPAPLENPALFVQNLAKNNVLFPPKNPKPLTQKLTKNEVPVSREKPKLLVQNLSKIWPGPRENPVVLAQNLAKDVVQVPRGNTKLLVQNLVKDDVSVPRGNFLLLTQNLAKNNVPVPQGNSEILAQNLAKDDVPVPRENPKLLAQNLAKDDVAVPRENSELLAKDKVQVLRENPELLANLAKDEDLMRIVYYYNLNISNRYEVVLAKRNLRKLKSLFYQRHYDMSIGDNVTMWRRMMDEGIEPFETFEEQSVNFRQCWSFQSFEYKVLLGISIPDIRCRSRIHTLECPSLIYDNIDFGIREMYNRHDYNYIKADDEYTVYDVIEALMNF